MKSNPISALGVTSSGSCSSQAACCANIYSSSMLGSVHLLSLLSHSIHPHQVSLVSAAPLSMPLDSKQIAHHERRKPTAHEENPLREVVCLYLTHDVEHKPSPGLGSRPLPFSLGTAHSALRHNPASKIKNLPQHKTYLDSDSTFTISGLTPIDWYNNWLKPSLCP